MHLLSANGQDCQEKQVRDQGRGDKIHGEPHPDEPRVSARQRGLAGADDAHEGKRIEEAISYYHGDGQGDVEGEEDDDVCEDEDDEGDDGAPGSDLARVQQIGAGLAAMLAR